MKISPLIAAALLAMPSLMAQDNSTPQVQASFTNFIRQVQVEAGILPANWVEWDLQNIQPSGEDLSPLAIDPGGARFELWTIKGTTPPVEYLLDTRYVGTYVPIGQVTIRTEDPYKTIPRTRADRPFFVDYSVTGLRPNDPTVPDAAKSVKFLHHFQSYGAAGTGVGLNRDQATLAGESSITENNENNTVTTLTVAANSLPGANRAKVRGEERFSLFSLEDYQVPSQQLASQFVQIWPVADGTITGLTDNQLVRFSMPTLTFTVNDVYPGSSVIVQAYKGPPVLGTDGTVIHGGGKNYSSETEPKNHLESVSNFDGIFDEDGQWTIELLTETPFGLERLDYVTFNLDLTIKMNGSVTTID